MTIQQPLEYFFVECSLGFAALARSESGLRALLLGDSTAELRKDLSARLRNLQEIQGRVPPPWVERVRRHLEDSSRPLEMPLDLIGTELQQQVWDALRLIPAGVCATYSEIAWRIGRPAAARAVARACAANPLAVVIPCHRVIRTDGRLAGYRWGIERKRLLLERESKLTTQNIPFSFTAPSGIG